MNTAFGKSLRHHWLLEEGLTYLDHGAYGATPNVVVETGNALRVQIERNPSAFIKRELPTRLRMSCSDLGDYVGGRGQDIVLVENATTAINAVLRSMVFMPGEEVLITNRLHPSVRKVVDFACHRAGIRLAIAELPFPSTAKADIFQAFEQQINMRTRLAILDHVTSPHSLVLPLAEMIEHCKHENIEVLIDGAHAPGMLELNLQDLGASWYIGNCHKWLGSVRGCGFLWVRESLQAGIRPTTISEGMGLSYVESFDWPGSKDFTSYLSVQTALEFRAQFGEDAIRQYCANLAFEAANALAELWKTEIGSSNNKQCFMHMIRLPFTGWADEAGAQHWRDTLRDDHNIEAKIIVHNQQYWVRISCYIYNDMDDYHRLGKVVQGLLS